MTHYFLGMALLAAPALIATAITGMAMPGGDTHLLVGLFAAIVTVAAHTLMILFMIVTGRVMKAAMESRPLPREFRDQYEIEYPTLIAGISDKDDASRKLPALDHVYAYPTTVFIDRSGVVRKIHTGFAGPATGEHYEALKRDFEDTIRALLAERGPGSDPDDGASATTGAMR
jgi:hypothetical protein